MSTFTKVVDASASSSGLDVIPHKRILQAIKDGDIDNVVSLNTVYRIDWTDYRYIAAVGKNEQSLKWLYQN